ncbi:hypothetical protein [Burkholderia glumae]|nr:hypothetical protein [Burkholderia glumae]
MALSKGGQFGARFFHPPSILITAPRSPGGRSGEHRPLILETI